MAERRENFATGWSVGIYFCDLVLSYSAVVGPVFGSRKKNIVSKYETLKVEWWNRKITYVVVAQFEVAIWRMSVRLRLSDSQQVTIIKSGTQQRPRYTIAFRMSITALNYTCPRVIVGDCLYDKAVIDCSKCVVVMTWAVKMGRFNRWRYAVWR